MPYWQHGLRVNGSACAGVPVFLYACLRVLYNATLTRRRSIAASPSDLLRGCGKGECV